MSDGRADLEDYDNMADEPETAAITEEPKRVVGENQTMELFSVQLEVMSRLLHAEQRKLSILERDLVQLKEPGIQNRKDHEQLAVNIRHIKAQHDQLHQEYNTAATEVLRRSNKTRRSSRSQPAIGLKQTPKQRPTIFGTLTKEQTQSSADRKRQSIGPQMSSLMHMFEMGNGYLANGVNGVDHKQGLLYQEGHLIAGSMESLTQHIVPTPDYCPDRTYSFAFLLNSRLFIKPHDLLGQVCQLCTYQQNLAHGQVNKESLGKFGVYMIRLLSDWTEMFPYDFRDERMMKHLKDITQRLVKIYPELRKDIGLLMHNLVTKLAGLQRYEELLSRINNEAAQRLNNIVPTTDIYEVAPSPLVFAQQLTHIELERLSNIGPEEFVQAFSKKSSDIEESFKDVKKTNNLEAYVHWFNRLSYFVATEICMHLKKKHRVRMIEYFIDVAKECVNIGNFNSLMAIIAGMNMTPVTRLKKTWAKVNTAKFEILEHQMDPSNNFSSYRSSLKAALWRSEGAVNDQEKIVIPFFSLFVKDMYFLNEGCSNKLQNGLINFEKFWQLAKQITEFINWRQVECPFQRQPPVLNYVLTNPVFTENSLSLGSFECEPPENNFEKERHKQLKVEAGL